MLVVDNNNDDDTDDDTDGDAEQKRAEWIRRPDGECWGSKCTTVCIPSCLVPSYSGTRVSVRTVRTERRRRNQQED